MLLQAFAQVAGTDPALHLVMAGPDQAGWRPALERQAQELGIASRVTWTGMLSGDLKMGAFHAAEVFVLPSHQENFGIAVAEALACGLPVLISNKVNIWREIKEDQAGFVAQDDVTGTRQLLQQWLNASPEKKTKCAQMRCAASVSALKSLTPRRVFFWRSASLLLRMGAEKWESPGHDDIHSQRLL